MSRNFAFSVLTLVLSISAHAQTDIVPDEVELAILKDIYDNMGGTGWTNKTNWPTPGNWPVTATSAQFGTWYGVTVVNGDVKGIDLRNNKLSGTIPASIGNLASVTNLIFNNNTIGGTLPSSLGDLSHIQSLQVHYNQIGGEIPATLGTLTSLQTLYLNNNQLTGSIPPQLGNLNSVQYLSLNNNKLTGSIPSELGSLSNAKSIQLSANQLSGSIPSSLGNLAALTHLYLNLNQLSGTIPAELGNLTNLQILHLFYNQLSGSIPSQLGSLGSLQNLQLNSNQLTGNIPAELGNLTGVQYLYLNNNKLTGSIPPELGNLSSVKNIQLNTNQLSGSIPSSLGNLGALTHLYLHANQLSGSMPVSLGNLSNLQVLHVFSNQLSGTIPSELGNLSNLQSLQLYSNQFTGNIPMELGNLTSVQYLFLNNNQLTGSIPLQLGNLTSIKSLQLNANQLSGSIPSSLGNLGTLTHLALQSNQLTGSIPSSLGNLSNLQILYLFSNQLSGEIPAELGNLYNLQNLQLFSNQLSGSIPAELGNLSSLVHLQLQLNQLQGVVPGTLGDLAKLKMIYLHGNQLEGEIPSQLGNLLQITHLNLSSNRLTGSIPVSFGNLSSLTSLYLNNNQLSGAVPSTLSSLPSILVIHLHQNELTGFPDFRSSPRKSTLILNVSNNRIPLGDMELNYTGPGQHIFSSLTYSPQKQLLHITPINVPAGATLNITALPAGANGAIIWDRRPIDSSIWSNINAENEDATQLTLKISGFQIEKLGFYRYRMTNSYVSGVTLESIAIETGILEPEVPADQVQLVLDDLAFQYRYDGRKRLIKKKVPGADWVYMVYDDQDRLVMTQDGNQRTHKAENGVLAPQWTWTKYDQLNRPIMGGIYTHDRPLEQEEMGVLISNAALFETRDAEEPHGYTENVFSSITEFIQANFDVMTVTYYDDDTYKALIPGNENFTYSGCDVDDQYFFSGSICSDKISFPRLEGMVTATKTRVLGVATPTWLWSVHHYDDEGRVVQTISMNALGGIDRSTSRYDFVGKVLETSTIHNVGGPGQQTLARQFKYDHAGRLEKTFHSVNSATPVLLVQNDYNELGELVTKKLHSTDGSNFKQHVDYRYNIRGWLTRINNANLDASDGGPNDYFGIEFGYDNDLGIGTFTPQYNGNISATKWSANLGLALPYLNEPTQRAYRFAYDPMNRLLEANYATKVGSWSSSLAYREAMDYDLNGNILSLYRNNGKGAAMDWLVYDYGDGSNKTNQLKAVTDYGTITNGFRDGNTSGDDYAYDGNGNFVEDKNKEISEIRFNSLNLIEEIDKATGEKIKYIYDADGIKLAEEIYLTGTQTPAKRIDYVGPLVYENDHLKFIVHEEGKIVIPEDQSGPEYQYEIKDHLGNRRLSFTTKEKVEVLKATMEDTGIADDNNPRVQEIEHFENLFETEIRNVNQWLNHTTNTIGNAIYLDGSEERTIGPYTVLRVYPGDTVKMEVFGKFENKSSHNTLPLTNILAALLTPIQSSVLGFDGGSSLTSNSLTDGLTPFLSTKKGNSDLPGAYINYILFDKDFNVVDLGYDRIDESAGFDPLQEAAVSFDKMELERIIDRVGYLYVYVSNESEGTRAWLDDLTITYSQSPIVQFEDYYPFGLSQSETAFERDNDNYNGMVTTDGTGLKDLGFRQFDAALGRFHAVDPLAELQIDQSTYQYSGNNPVNQIDLLGLKADKADDTSHDKVKNKPKPPKRDKHKRRQRVKEDKGYSRYKAEKKDKRQGANNSQAAQTKRRKSKKSETSTAKKNDKSGGNANASKTSGNKSQSGSSESDPSERSLFNTLVSGPPLRNGSERLATHSGPAYMHNSRHNNGRQPRFELRIDNDIDAGTPSVVQLAELGETVTDIELYRQHLIRNEFEWRALYSLMLAGRNSNYQSNRLKESSAAVGNTLTSVASVLLPEDPILVEFADGGIPLSYDGTDGVLRRVGVSVKKDKELPLFNVLEVYVDDFTPRDSPEHAQIFRRGAEEAKRWLQAEEARRNGHFRSREDIEDYLLSRQDDLKEYMKNLRNEAETGDVKDFLGIDPVEKAEIQSSIDKFRNEQGLNSEVKILDKEFFDQLKWQYENGHRTPDPDKEVTLLITKDPKGKVQKHFVYKDGLFVLPTQKTKEDGTIIQLEGTMKEFESVRDRFIDSAIEYDQVQLYDEHGLPKSADAEKLVVTDANGSPITIDPQEKPFLNIFEKGMWVITASRDLLREVEIAEKRWNKDLNQNTWPVDVPHPAAGMGNAMLDEAKSIPEMVAFGLSMFDKKVRQTLWESITNINWSTFENIFYDKVEKYEKAPIYEGSYDATTIIFGILSGGKKVFDELDGVLKKSGKLGDIDWGVIRAKNLPDAQIEKLAKDIAGSDGLQAAFKLSPDLVDVWKLIDDELADAGELIRKNPDALKQIDAAIKEGLDGTDAVRDAVQTLGKTKPTWPEVQALFKRGNDFNRKAKTSGWYDYHEVHLSNGKRLDSYDPDLGEIVSRKATDFDNIQTSTFENYLKEMDSKYAPGTVIRSDKYPDIDGQTLQGSKILEVPASNQTSSRLTEFTQLAQQYNVTIKFQVE